MKKMLLMDDNRSIREQLSRVFKGFGFETDLASEGSSAVLMFRNAYINKIPYDITILDINIETGMNGENALRRIKKMDANAPVIISSGYIDNRFLRNNRYAYLEFLSKPYKIKHLYSLINEMT